MSLGQGTLDWDGILKAAQRPELNGISTYRTAVAVIPLEYTNASYEFLKKKLA